MSREAIEKYFEDKQRKIEKERWDSLSEDEKLSEEIDDHLQELLEHRYSNDYGEQETFNDNELRGFNELFTRIKKRLKGGDKDE